MILSPTCLLVKIPHKKNTAPINKSIEPEVIKKLRNIGWPFSFTISPNVPVNPEHSAVIPIKVHVKAIIMGIESTFTSLIL
jgi:hypothetical protein